MPPGAPVAVRASTSRCRLYHTGAIAETVLLGLGDAVQRGPRWQATDEAADVVGRWYVALEDRFTFSVDASGELLHRRGARIEVGAAPLRETLAAGLLALAGWEPGLPLVDPMCGAGTIPIEAALQAVGRAPGLERAFAFAVDELAAVFGEAPRRRPLRDEARARLRAPAGGAHRRLRRDPRAIETARRNAARAGVDAQLRFACRDVADARPPPPRPGW